VVLTKLDGDARGGAALSIAQLTGRPVMFASTGEKLEDFDVFHPDRMASRILDMGDMLTLIEQAERTFDAEQTAAMAGKLVSGEGFTLEDFVEQLAMVRKMGPISNLLGMLPGAQQNKELLSQVTDADLDHAAAIVNSMTPAERRNPKILNGSRRARIAKGSGTTVGEVNNLVVRFLEGQKMMRQMLGGGGIPGMPGIPGMRRAATKAAKGKKGSGKKKPKGGRPGGAPGRSSGGAGTAPSRSAGGPAGLGGAGLPGLGGAGGLGGPGDLSGPSGLRNLPGALSGLPPGLGGPGALPPGLGSKGRSGDGAPGTPDHQRSGGTSERQRSGGAQDGRRADRAPESPATAGTSDGRPASGAPNDRPGTGGAADNQPATGGAADNRSGAGRAADNQPATGGAPDGQRGGNVAPGSTANGGGSKSGGADEGPPGGAASDLPAGLTPPPSGRGRLLGRRNKKR
jgi:Signal peptide binding domain/SRP54-type protein, GTPase domain